MHCDSRSAKLENELSVETLMKVLKQYTLISMTSRNRTSMHYSSCSQIWDLSIFQKGNRTRTLKMENCVAENVHYRWLLFVFDGLEKLTQNMKVQEKQSMRLLPSSVWTQSVITFDQVKFYIKIRKSVPLKLCIAQKVFRSRTHLAVGWPLED